MPYAKGEVMNITVYLGASKGNDNTLANAVRELGTWIGESGNSLVYGGSKSGLMGEIAESVLRAGGRLPVWNHSFLLMQVFCTKMLQI